jgi:hypothetical protein
MFLSPVEELGINYAVLNFIQWKGEFLDNTLETE